MRPYAERKEARIVRLRARAERALADAHGAHAGARAILDRIPLGQPILVGHHSEKRHRRDLARADSAMRKGFEAGKAAEDLARRADAAEESTAISSDDPDAVVKLREKLAELQALQTRYALINKTNRAAKRTAGAAPWEPVAVQALAAVGISDRETAVLVSLDFAGRVGVPGYRLSNNSAEIRRVEKRIQYLTAHAARATPAPEVYGAVRVEESENRVRIYFPGKPAEACRKELKSNGFRWSPTEGAWQRMAGDYAWQLARALAQKATT